MPNIKDVAKKAGVSISTVSNVLNDTKFVSEELKKKVQDAVQELNYKVDPIARNMKTRKTKTIGLITADVCGLFYPFLIKGVYEVANQRGYQVMICDSAGEYGEQGAIEREKENFDKMFANKVGGIIFASVTSPHTDKEYWYSLKKKTFQHQNIPLVSIEQDFSEVGIDSVYFDCYANSVKATEHLVECGCKKIAHVTGPVFSNVVKERMQGYRDAMKKSGLDVKDIMIAYGDYTHQSGYKAAKTLIQNAKGLDGIFFANDLMALGALRAFKELNIRIPEDIKIIGYDNTFASGLVDPSLSTIHIPKRHTGKLAMQLLVDQIENPVENRKVQKIKVEGRLVVRQSTVSGASDDRVLAD